MGFKKDYVEEMTSTIMKINPSFQKEKIESIVNRLMEERLKDPYIHMDNNVTGENHDISLVKLYNWIKKRNPVISGNATFYCQHHEQLSPTSNMLRAWKRERKAMKKEMFSFMPESDEYMMADLGQMNKKVIMNAEYGGSGAPTAAFYTKYSPPATTLMSQSIITVMAALFEGYIGDNQKFFNTNECFDWMNVVRKKDMEIPKWVTRHTSEEVYHRILKHFYVLDPNIFPALKGYLDNCNEHELVYLYYANNFKEFIRDHKIMRDLIISVLSKLPNYEAAVGEVPDEYKTKFPWTSNGKHVVDYNRFISREMFLDPYSIPDVIKDDMEKFISLMTQFIYVNYITPDSIVKLNNHKRNTVLLVDTDSNMINSDIFVSFVLDEILEDETFGRKKIYNEMILINVLAASLDRSVANLLNYYCECHNIGEEYRSELTMKNEFMFRRFLLMKVKKRYVASIVLREGNIIIPFKAEVKGVDFIKAGVSDDVEKRFRKILEDHILYSDELELHELVSDVKKFEKDIHNDLKEGGTRYLKQQQFKAVGGYKNAISAWRLPVFRGTMAWNELYPENKIYSLDRVSILKTTVLKPSDLDVIKDMYPTEYNDVLTKIYMSDYDEIKKSGLKYICIPSNIEKIPEWLLPVIDYEMIVSDVISSFRSVSDALRIENTTFKTPNGKASMMSCLISI